MCKQIDYNDNCANCKRATNKLDDDGSHCRKCAADDKTKGPFSRHQRRK